MVKTHQRLKEAYICKNEADIHWITCLTEAMERCNKWDKAILEEEAKIRIRSIETSITVDWKSRTNDAIDHIRKEALKELKKRMTKETLKKLEK